MFDAIIDAIIGSLPDELVLALGTIVCAISAIAFLCRMSWTIFPELGVDSNWLYLPFVASLIVGFFFGYTLFGIGGGIVLGVIGLIVLPGVGFILFLYGFPVLGFILEFFDIVIIGLIAIAVLYFFWWLW